MKITFTELTLLGTITATTIALTALVTTPAYSQTNDTSSYDNVSKFKKTDTSLLYEIETNLKKYSHSKDYNEAELIKPPKQRRFEIAEKGIKKLIYKNSIPNTLYGSAIGVAATAHPAGFLLGGITGLLQGKSDRYEEAQGRIHQMKLDIFESSNHELTEDEILLASYTGVDLSEFLALAPKPEPEIEITNKGVDESHTPPIINTAMGHTTSSQEEKLSNLKFENKMVVAKKEVLPPPDVDYCHDLMIGNAKPVDNITRRELVSFCFYHMN